MVLAPRPPGRQLAHLKPDTDNLEKALKDEMTRLHFWHDDAQVCSEIVEKFWSAPCGVFVRVEVWG